jgi:hypothetical protein
VSATEDGGDLNDAVLEVETSFPMPFHKPRVNIAVDDRRYVTGAGIHRIRVAPGEHTIVISYHSEISTRLGEATITVTVAPSEVRHLRYRGPWLNNLPGKITVGARVPGAKLVKRTPE